MSSSRSSREPGVGHQVERTPQAGLEVVAEGQHVLDPYTGRCLDEEVDVGVWAGLSSGNGPEHGQPGEPASPRDIDQDRRGSVEEGLRVHVATDWADLSC